MSVLEFIDSIIDTLAWPVTLLVLAGMLKDMYSDTSEDDHDPKSH